MKKNRSNATKMIGTTSVINNVINEFPCQAKEHRWIKQLIISLVECLYPSRLFPSGENQSALMC